MNATTQWFHNGNAVTDRAAYAREFCAANPHVKSVKFYATMEESLGKAVPSTPKIDATQLAALTERCNALEARCNALEAANSKLNAVVDQLAAELEMLKTRRRARKAA